VTLVQWVERSRVFGFAIIIALLIVAVGWNRGADAGSGIATALATTTITPSNTSSGGIDNGLAGNTFIKCSAGTGLSQNNLVLLGINTLSVGTTITPPATGPGHPAWNLIDTETVNGDYTQQYYWHEVGTGEVGTGQTGGPTFVFNFSSGVRAACVAVAYTNTCLDSPSGCPNGNPIFALTVGTASDSGSVTETSPPPNFGEINIPDDSLIAGVFGTSDTNSRFADSSANIPEIAGYVDNGLSPVNGVSGKNGGIMIANKTESFAAVDGPFTAELPIRGNNPTTQITSITGDGATVTGTVQIPALLNQSTHTFQANITSVTGGSPPDCFNVTSVTVTPTLPATFTYSSACSGTGDASSATLAILDPSFGDNVAQVVSILPNTQ
jgi:hypothetical protein